MLNITDIAFSCYAVTDMARARSFYEGVLGLKPTMVFGEPGGMQWTDYDIGAGTLALGSAPGWKASPDGCTVAFEVAGFDAAIAKLREHKVVFRIEPMASPVCQMAMIHDPDGNTLCIHQRKAAPVAGS